MPHLQDTDTKRLRTLCYTVACFVALAVIWRGLGGARSTRADKQDLLYNSWTAAYKDVKKSPTWLRMWKTQVLGQLEALQAERAFQPLHLYMNGDSSFRQQKNFLCSILQPGFERRGGPCFVLDPSCVLKETESSCYNAELNVRVTYIENNCCDVERLGYLSAFPKPPKLLYPWEGSAATGNSSPIASSTSTNAEATKTAFNSSTVAINHNSAPVRMSLRSQLVGKAAAASASRTPEEAGVQQLPHDRAGLGLTATMPSPDAAVKKSTQPAPAWAPGGLDNTTVVAYLNCGLHLFHLGAAREFECMVEQIEYEDVLQGFGLEAEKLYPGVPQVWMTSNYVCEGNFKNAYADALLRIRNDTGGAVSECLHATATPEKAGPYAGDAEARERACRDGLFLSKNSKLLRDRMVSALQAEELRSAVSWMGLVDAFALTEGQCWASQSHDGRHYPMLVPTMVTELLTVVRRQLLGRAAAPGRSAARASRGHPWRA